MSKERRRRDGGTKGARKTKEGKRANGQREKREREADKVSTSSKRREQLRSSPSSMRFLCLTSSYRKSLKAGISSNQYTPQPPYTTLSLHRHVCMTQLIRVALSVLTLFHSCICQPRKEGRKEEGSMPLPACVSPMHSCDG